MVQNVQNEQSIIKSLQTECQDYLLEIAKKEREIARLTAHIDELRIQLASKEGTGALVRQLYNTIDNSIMSTINKRGAIKENSSRKHPKLGTVENMDLSSLLLNIHEYDIKNFFSYRPRIQHSHLKTRYRIAGKVYRTTRDGSRQVLGRVYRRLRGSK